MRSIASRESPRTEGWGVHNETRRGSLGSACLSFKAQGIGIGNSNKFSSVFFFGTFLLDKQKKGTRLSCAAAGEMLLKIQIKKAKQMFGLPLILDSGINPE